MVFCTSCGTEAKAGQKFCASCGTAISSLGGSGGAKLTRTQTTNTFHKPSTTNTKNWGSQSFSGSPSPTRNNFRNSIGGLDNRNLNAQEGAKVFGGSTTPNSKAGILRSSAGGTPSWNKFDGAKSDNGTTKHTSPTPIHKEKKNKKENGFKKALRSVTTTESDNPFLAKEHKHLNATPKEDKQQRRASLRTPQSNDDSWIGRAHNLGEAKDESAAKFKREGEEDESTAEKMMNLLTTSLPSLPSLKFGKTEEKDPVKERWKKEKKERKERERREREEKEREEREKEKKEREKEKERERKIREKEKEIEREEREREKEKERQRKEKEREEKEKEKERLKKEKEREEKERERKEKEERDKQQLLAEREKPVLREKPEDAAGVKSLAKLLPRSGKKEEEKESGHSKQLPPEPQSQPAELYSRAALSPVKVEETRRPPPQDQPTAAVPPWAQGAAALKKVPQPQPQSEAPQPQPQPPQPALVRKPSYETGLSSSPSGIKKPLTVNAYDSPPPSPVRREPATPPPAGHPPPLTKRPSLDGSSSSNSVPQSPGHRREAPPPPSQQVAQHQLMEEEEPITVAVAAAAAPSREPSRNLIAQLQQHQLKDNATRKVALTHSVGTVASRESPKRPPPLQKALSGDQIHPRSVTEAPRPEGHKQDTPDTQLSPDLARKPSIMNRMKVKFTISRYVPQPGDLVEAFYVEDQKWYNATVLSVRPSKKEKGVMRYYVVYAGYAKVEQKVPDSRIRTSGGRISAGRPSQSQGPLPPPGSLSKPPKHKLGWKNLFSSKDAKPTKASKRSDVPMPGMYAGRMYKPKMVKLSSIPPPQPKYQSHGIRASKHLRNSNVLSLEDAFSRAYADVLPMFAAMAVEGEGQDGGYGMLTPPAPNSMGNPLFPAGINRPTQLGGSGLAIPGVPGSLPPGSLAGRRTGTKKLPPPPSRPPRPAIENM